MENVKAEVEAAVGKEKVLSFEYIEVSSLKLPEKSLRRDYKESSATHQGSIKKHGVLTPLTVCPLKDKPEGYEVLDGVRTFLAAKTVGLTHVPVTILNITDEAEKLIVSITKNTRRKSLSPIELADAIHRLKSDFKYNGEEVEGEIGITASRQTQLLNLRKLPEGIQEEIHNGKGMNEARGRALLKLKTPEQQENWAKIAKKRNYSAKQLEGRIAAKIRKDAAKQQLEEQKLLLTPEQLSAIVPNVYFKSSANMNEVPDGSIHLAWGSPNYGLGYDFEKGLNPMTAIEETKPVLDEVVKKLHSGCFLILNIMDIVNHISGKGGNKQKEWLYVGVKYQEYLRTLGLHLRDVVIWNKPNRNWAHDSDKFPVSKVHHTDYRFSQQNDQILIFQMEGERTDMPNEVIQAASHLSDEEYKQFGKNVWDINLLREGKVHPCEFPEELCTRVIKMFSFEGDTVLDPWLGSGTTVKVANDLGRVGVGYEKELMYKPVIMKKLGIDEKVETMKEFTERTLAQTTVLPEAVSSQTDEAEVSVNQLIGNSSGAEMGASA